MKNRNSVSSHMTAAQSDWEGAGDGATLPGNEVQEVRLRLGRFSFVPPGSDSIHLEPNMIQTITWHIGIFPIALSMKYR